MNASAGNPLLSVIIPVYNVENYVAEAVKSVLSQSYSPFEIILVDDGSTDCSGSICDDFARNDSRVTVIHKRNGGLSSARNAGLEIAQGSYITFIDSDDWVEDGTYEKNMDILIRDASIDILQFPTCDYRDPGKQSPGEMMLTGEKEIFTNWWEASIITAAVWNKIFRKNVFSAIRFPEGQVHEDHFLITDFLKVTDKLYLSEQGRYHYMVREDSITTARSTVKRNTDFFRAHLKVYTKFCSFDHLRPFKVTAFSRVYRKLILARQVDKSADLRPFVSQLKGLVPEWSDIIISNAGLKQIFWMISLKLTGMSLFMSAYLKYLDLREMMKRRR